MLLLPAKGDRDAWLLCLLPLVLSAPLSPPPLAPGCSSSAWFEGRVYPPPPPTHTIPLPLCLSLCPLLFGCPEVRLCIVLKTGPVFERCKSQGLDEEDHRLVASAATRALLRYQNTSSWGSVVGRMTAGVTGSMARP